MDPKSEDELTGRVLRHVDTVFGYASQIALVFACIAYGVSRLPFTTLSNKTNEVPAVRTRRVAADSTRRNDA